MGEKELLQLAEELDEQHKNDNEKSEAEKK